MSFVLVKYKHSNYFYLGILYNRLNIYDRILNMIFFPVLYTRSCELFLMRDLNLLSITLLWIVHLCIARYAQIGTFKLDEETSLTDELNRKQTVMTWISTRTQSPFELINDGRGIKCTINGTIKVEISMTVVVPKDPALVLVCLNLKSVEKASEKLCQPTKITELPKDTTFPFPFVWLYDVREGDVIEISVVGKNMIYKAKEFNRMIAYYI